MTLYQAFRRVAVGLIVGLPLAIGVARLIVAQLYAVPSWDPLALAAAGSLGACAFVAAIIPAARAEAFSPMGALRVE